MKRPFASRAPITALIAGSLLASLGATALAIQRVGGTDHLDFDHVGLPAFQFVQDPIDYDTRTHHTNMDVLESLQEADLQQAAAVVAAFVYHTAMRDEKLPRTALPKAPQVPRP